MSWGRTLEPNSVYETLNAQLSALIDGVPHCIASLANGSFCRKHYQHLCGLLRSLIKFGGSRYAQILIDELHEACPDFWLFHLGDV